MHPLVELTELSHPIILDMRYATKKNFTEDVIYESDRCLLHQDAIPFLERAIALASQQNLTLKILDAYRPQKAQERLWEVCPDPQYVIPPERGSHHTRGVAVDVTLVDANGRELDMGTGFDVFLPASHHGSIEISQGAALNRYKLLGIMMSAGWDFYVNEWWHYQLFSPRSYDLIDFGFN